MPTTRSNSLQNDESVEPTKQRTRSLSGPSHPIALSPHVRHSALISGGLSTSYRGVNNRRQSDDESLSTFRSRISPTTGSFLETFRPRSTSDSKSKKPSMMTTLKNNLLGSSGSANHHNSANNNKNSSCPVTPNHFDPFLMDRLGEVRPRSRSGSSGSSGAVSRMIDMFRGRSHSIASGAEPKQVKLFGSGEPLCDRIDFDDLGMDSPLLLSTIN